MSSYLRLSQLSTSFTYRDFKLPDVVKREVPSEAVPCSVNTHRSDIWMLGASLFATATKF